MGRNITAEHIQRILVNPFYAIQVASHFVANHTPSLSDGEWVKVNATLMQEQGAEHWLTLFLDLLQGETLSEEKPFNPYNAINIDPMYAVEHPPLFGVAQWIQSNVRLIEELGREQWLRLLLDVLEGDFVTADEIAAPPSASENYIQFGGKKRKKKRRKK